MEGRRIFPLRDRSEQLVHLSASTATLSEFFRFSSSVFFCFGFRRDFIPEFFLDDVASLSPNLSFSLLALVASLPPDVPTRICPLPSRRGSSRAFRFRSLPSSKVSRLSLNFFGLCFFSRSPHTTVICSLLHPDLLHPLFRLAAFSWFQVLTAPGKKDVPSVPL